MDTKTDMFENARSKLSKKKRELVSDEIVDFMRKNYDRKNKFFISMRTAYAWIGRKLSDVEHERIVSAYFIKYASSSDILFKLIGGEIYYKISGLHSFYNSYKPKNKVVVSLTAYMQYLDDIIYNKVIRAYNRRNDDLYNLQMVELEKIDTSEKKIQEILKTLSGDELVVCQGKWKEFLRCKAIKLKEIEDNLNLIQKNVIYDMIKMSTQFSK